MIYLFCNNSYGARFQQEFMDYPRLEQSEKIIVYSGYKRGAAKNVLTRILRASKSTFMSAIDRFKEMALSQKYGLQVRIVSNVNSPSFCRQIQSEDRGLISGFNQIFSQQTISRFRSLVNFHPSILPLYRGPVPSYWCIRNGESHTGFTLHTVTTDIDRGEILYQGGILSIGKTTDPDALDERLAQIASRVMATYLDSLLGFGRLERRTLNAFEIYDYHVDYASFPKGN